MSAHFILVGIACLCFFIAAVWGFIRAAPPAPAAALNLEALGLFFWALSELVR